MIVNPINYLELTTLGADYGEEQCLQVYMSNAAIDLMTCCDPSCRIAQVRSLTHIII